MKEYIFQIDNVTTTDIIVVPNAPAGLAIKNILAIINKSTQQPVHSPVEQNIASVNYNSTVQSMIIALKEGAPTPVGDLLIKAYSDEGDGGYDELLAQFFGITEATEYTAATPAEVIDELKEVFAAEFGVETDDSLLPNSVTVDGNTYSGTTNND